MATTALKIIQGGLVKRIKFASVPAKDHLDIDVFVCVEEFVPIGSPTRIVDLRDEETFHKEFRKEAHFHGHFVPEQSTDPEWNEGL